MKSIRTHCHVMWPVFWNRYPDEGDRFGRRKVALSWTTWSGSQQESVLLDLFAVETRVHVWF